MSIWWSMTGRTYELLQELLPNAAANNVYCVIYSKMASKGSYLVAYFKKDDLFCS